MDRCGGYAGYALLREDARAFEDVLIVMAGEHDAEVIRRLEKERASYGEAAIEPVAAWSNEPVT